MGGMEISSIIAEWKGKLRMTNTMKDSAILADRIYYPKGADVPNSVDSEDLSLALVYLQHQTRKGLYALIANAHMDDDTSNHDDAIHHGEFVTTESCTVRHF